MHFLPTKDGIDTSSLRGPVLRGKTLAGEFKAIELDLASHLPPFLPIRFSADPAKVKHILAEKKNRKKWTIMEESSSWELVPFFRTSA